LQNRIIKKSVLEGLKEKTKNNQNNTSFKLHMKKTTTNFSLQQNKQCLCTTFSLSHTTFLLYRSLHKLSNYNDKNNQLKDVKKK